MRRGAKDKARRVGDRTEVESFEAGRRRAGVPETKKRDEVAAKTEDEERER